jgi:outer membrane lipoprotein-sorting protein
MRKLLTAILFFLLAIAFLPWRLHAENLPLEEVISRVKQVYSGYCCFKANFDQVRVNPTMNMRDHFKGIMYVKKPASIALDVMSPEKQKVVIRGKRYMVYFPEDGNAARGEVPPNLNVQHFIDFFGKIEVVDQNFYMEFSKKPSNESDSLYFIELTDRKDKTSPYTIVLGIDAKQFTVRRTIVYDALMNYNRFDLSNITFLKDIPDSQFSIDYENMRKPTPPTQLKSVPK